MYEKFNNFHEFWQYWHMKNIIVRQNIILDKRNYYYYHEK